MGLISQILSICMSQLFSGYLLQCVILTLISFICALVILLIINSFTDWILWLVDLLW